MPKSPRTSHQKVVVKKCCKELLTAIFIQKFGYGTYLRNKKKRLLHLFNTNLREIYLRGYNLNINVFIANLAYILENFKLFQKIVKKGIFGDCM